MSYEPSAHTAQIAILRHLLFCPEAGFADLQKKTSLTSDSGQALYKMGVANSNEFIQLNKKARPAIETYAYEFPDVLEIRDELIKRIAEVAYPAVY